MERDSWLNNTDASLERRISPFDHTFRFVTGINYELPIGRGRLLNLNSRWMNTLVGGWQVNGIYTYQTGQPLLWENGSTNNPSDYPLCNVATANGVCPAGSETAWLAPNQINFNPRQVDSKSFNTAQFVTASGSQYAFHLRTLPTTISAIRQDGQNNLDASVVKKFAVGERMNFQFRCEAFNLMNHPIFAAPNMAATNASFGQITSQANRPRQLQLGLRFVF
jgi:hypothetical protein